MNPLKDYRRLRTLGFGPARAWQLAGVQKVVLPTLRGAALAAVLLVAYGVVTRSAEAVNVAADNRVAAKIAKQEADIAQLALLLGKCLSGGDSPITIGDEIWLCGATNTGIKHVPKFSNQ